MKCQKCAKQAIVHLTEIITDPHAEGSGAGAGFGDEGKRAVEIHLCLAHAIEAGLIVPGPEVPTKIPAAPSESQPDSEASAEALPTAIVPAPVEATDLVVTRPARPGELCPHCGMSWQAFKQAGLMGCSHDYEAFGGKILAIVKRAQEGATHHIGKLPRHQKTGESERHVVSLRLRRELQKAIDAEHYEEAAQLRDQLRQLEHTGTSTPGSR